MPSDGSSTIAPPRKRAASQRARTRATASVQAPHAAFAQGARSRGAGPADGREPAAGRAASKSAAAPAAWVDPDESFGNASLDVAVATHAGLVRERNEDCARIDLAARVFVLADGMGGHNAGDVASSLAVTTIADRLAGGHPADSEPRRTLDLMRSAIEAANAAIASLAAEREECRGMGTTVVCGWLRGRKLSIGHLGDSRAYLLRDGAMHRLTRDHSLGQAMADAGVAGRRHPMRGVLTRALGAGAVAEPDLVQITLRVGDRVLLCSDGLTDMVDDATIAGIFAAAADAGAATQRLTEQALAAGGFDNVTALAVFIDEAPAR